MFISPFFRDQFFHSLQGEDQIYLVGGAIRDSFLGLKRKDLDFVCSGDTREIARRFADQVGGNFYTLDKDRDIYRVLSTPGEDLPGVFDFARLRGNEIEADLQQRDFTINAMAVNLRNPEMVIDPFHGIRDLQMKKLIPVSGACLSDDPVRVIRAMRYSASYQLSISREFSKTLRDSVNLLGTISIERVRDEVFKMMDSDHPQTGLRLLEHFGILQYFDYGNPDEVRSGIDLALKTDELLRVILFGNNELVNRSFLNSSFMVQLGRFKSRLQEIYCTVQTSGRTRKAVMLFSCLTLKSKQQGKTKLYENFGLSSNEISMIAVMQREFEYVQQFLQSAEEPDRRAIYKFYKNANEVGVDLVLVSLADQLTKPVSEISSEQWIRALSCSNLLLDAWFERREIVSPASILSGNDLMFQFDLPPGPRIGELIESLKEEQAAGNITDKKSALAWVDQMLIKFS